MEERKTRKGKLHNTPNGPMYQHHDVWIGTFEQWYIEKISEDWGVDQNHVIGKIVDQFVAENADLHDRLKFFEEVALPNVKKKYAK